MWPFGKFENRESATDAIVSALIAQAGGSSVPPTVEALGAVEAAAGLWSRAFASATVEPSTPATMALTPAVLAAIGRGLAVRGEAVFALDVNGAVELTQAASWKVAGGTRPESWRYEVELPLPSGKVAKRTLPAESVLHVRYATRPGAPWAGISPLGMADETRALATWIERRLAEETSTATSYVLPLPEGGNVDALKADIKGGRGRLHIVDTTAAAWGDGTASAPRADWKSTAWVPTRLRAWASSAPKSRRTYSASTASLRASTAPAALRVRATGSSWRPPSSPLRRWSSLRNWPSSWTLQRWPWTFPSCGPRTYQGGREPTVSLINAGMPPAEAAEATGLDYAKEDRRWSLFQNLPNGLLNKLLKMLKQLLPSFTTYVGLRSTFGTIGNEY